MKRLLRDWGFGFHLLLRLLIASLCMAFGAGILAGLQASLQVVHHPMPYFAVLLLEVLYVAGCCPLILASYARYVGFIPRASGVRV